MIGKKDIFTITSKNISGIFIAPFQSVPLYYYNPEGKHSI